jgi:hypothetical protein
MTATERKLRRKIFTLAEDCYALAYTVLNNTAGEDQPEYDRSRTWCDRHDDYDFAKHILRKVRPTLTAHEKARGNPPA